MNPQSDISGLAFIFSVNLTLLLRSDYIFCRLFYK
nr:MAG TPA: hypothetical protein [Crassvirales sp.]